MRRIAVLAYVRQNPGATSLEIAEACGTTKRFIRQLRTDGYLENTEPRTEKPREAKRYLLTDAGLHFIKRNK